jgi:hypothetical protein
MKGNIIEILLNVMERHEKSAAVVGETFRALVNLSTLQPCPLKIRVEESFKLYVRGMKIHEKIENVARWGCNLIFACAIDDQTRSRLGDLKACEAVVVALQKHGVASSQLATWACKALVALSLFEPNKLRFVNSETCSAIIKILEVLP